MIIKNSKKRRAFTLAEVLITLLIIGVVSSIVIPILINQFEEQTKTAQIKKVYSTLLLANQSIKQDNGGPVIFDSGDTLDGYSNKIKDLYKGYLSYIRDCNSNASGTCWHLNSQFFQSDRTPTSSLSGGWFHCAGLIGSDGTLFRFYYYSPECNYNSHDQCGTIYVDINGFEKPNTICKDIYGLVIGKEKLYPTSCMITYLK